jgi:hypothetical protein
LFSFLGFKTSSLSPCTLKDAKKFSCGTEGSNQTNTLLFYMKQSFVTSHLLESSSNLLKI